MSELAKTYEPNAVEAKWYDFWLENGCFRADPARVSDKRPAFSIVIPPPNVTGVLTLGHVLNNTIQDILARRARMLGKEVLWLPGTDHAGIATQNVVEKTLRKEGAMKHRDDLGREALVAKIWEWKEKYGGIIIQQLKKLGASCDWSRERFTMDPAYSQCVSRVFVELYKKGLIYRGKRMVNWCPASLTALSDEEVIMKEQNGILYYFKVEVAELPGTWLTIATTRPETIPGDTAVAVNPKDGRYAHLIGKHVRRPLPAQIPDEQKLIPIVGDDHVDFEFGTGVLKVTPAHDKADFEIGLRHQLPVVDIMNPDGTMNTLAGESLAGLERFKARKLAAEHLGELGVLEKEEPYQNKVGYSERADVPIEPRLSEQWFLKYPSTAEARACVSGTMGLAGGMGVPPAEPGVPPGSSAETTHGDSDSRSTIDDSGKMPESAGGTPTLPARMRFFPERWAKVYDHWMENIQDWCISRQLWWGHRVPVWSIELSGDEIARDHPQLQSVMNLVLEKVRVRKADSIEDATSFTTKLEIRDCPEDLHGRILPRGNDLYRVEVALDSERYGRYFTEMGFTQDPDVLDTWFSSWLWPFATMGWPEKTETLAKFYPTTDLVTGPDIIFFWVARMIMAGYEFMGDLPFRNVYFTGIIRDKQGRKMSKSLGNSPDPLDLIAQYGADALRFGVMRSAPLGADVIYDEKNVELGRNFCTKLWNASRFRQMQGGATEGEIRPDLLTSDDRWILARLDGAIEEVTVTLTEYRFSDAASALYRFFWNELCDWYLEAAKAALQGTNEALKANTLAVLDFVLGHTLRLFHPFLPFITEELWHGMGFDSDLPAEQGGKTIMTAPWPKTFGAEEREYFGLDAAADQFAAAKYEVVNLGRSLRRDFNIASSKRVRFVLRSTATLAPHDIEVLRILLNAEPLEVLAEYTAPKGTPAVLTPLGELFLPLEGLIDVAAEKERLAKEIAKVDQELGKVRAKLADPNFSAKVPAKVLDEHRQREKDWAEKYAQLKKMLEDLGE
ncbi:MAG TPA: valine--tRNA ligase [Chthoniobacter sp.]